MTHVRDAVEQRRDVSGDVGVPGVGVHQVGAGDVRNDLQVDPEGLDRGVGGAQVFGHGVGRDRRSVIPGLTGRAEGTHL